MFTDERVVKTLESNSFLISQQQESVMKYARGLSGDMIKFMNQSELLRYRLLMHPFKFPSRMGRVPPFYRAEVRNWFRDFGPNGTGEWLDDHAFDSSSEERYQSSSISLCDVHLDAYDGVHPSFQSVDYCEHTMAFIMSRVFQDNVRPFLAGDLMLCGSFRTPVTLGQEVIHIDPQSGNAEFATVAYADSRDCWLVFSTDLQTDVQQGSRFKMRTVPWTTVRTIVVDSKVVRSNAYLENVWNVMEDVMIGKDHPSKYNQ